MLAGAAASFFPLPPGFFSFLSLALLLAELPLKRAVRLCADLTGEARNALYDAALALREDRPVNEDEGNGAD